MGTFPRGHSARDANAKNAKVIKASVSSSTQPGAKVTFTYSAGDGITLRGIPAIGRGVAGAIPGSSPHNR